MPNPTVFVFRISLKGVDPPIWRLLVVLHNITFLQLHMAIEDAMGWKGQHLFMFDRFSTAPNFSIDHPVGPITNIRLEIGHHFRSSGDSAMYLYDFYHRWEHLITLERIQWGSPSVQYPICAGGELACPPENLPHGAECYAWILSTVSDPTHQERGSTLAYLVAAGGSDKPEHFDYESVVFRKVEAPFWILPICGNVLTPFN